MDFYVRTGESTIRVVADIVEYDEDKVLAPLIFLSKEDDINPVAIFHTWDYFIRGDLGS